MGNGGYGGMGMYDEMIGMEQANMGRVSGGPSRKRARNDNQQV